VRVSGLVSPWGQPTVGGGALAWATGLDWHDQALCREVGSSLFFAEDQGDDAPKLGKRICNGTETQAPCPVREQCLEWALEVEDNWAVLGGMTPRQRHKLAAQRRRDAGGRPCQVCGQLFDADPNTLHCSDGCRAVSRQRRDARRTQRVRRAV
jgi:WhiB family redox-sensing transcriptional regulator